METKHNKTLKFVPALRASTGSSRFTKTLWPDMHKHILYLTVPVFLSGCVNIAVGISCVVDPPAEEKPEIEYGEFPFHLEYEVNGVSTVIDDVVICSYEGRACDGRGLHNKWRSEFTDGTDKIVIKKLSDSQSIITSIGSCRTLMAGEIPEVRHSAGLETLKDTWTIWEPVTAQELRDKYAITLTEKYAAKRP